MTFSMYNIHQNPKFGDPKFSLDAVQIKTTIARRQQTYGVAIKGGERCFKDHNH